MTGSNGRAKRHFFGGTGLYIALFLGVTALAVAGYWTLLPHGAADDAQDMDADSALSAGDEIVMPEIEVLPEEDVFALSAGEIALSEAREGAEDRSAEEAAADAQDDAQQMPEVMPAAPRLVVSPLVGETLAAFSMEELHYNETLGDWRTHDGIDIAASVGTQVLAACSGTVISVTDDDLMGTSVTIRHDGGYETTYANLQSIPTVGEGQHVAAGEVIGAVGATSIAEFASAPHLHFSVTKDGIICDPGEFLKG